MEGLLTGFAYGAFALAACFLVASVVIFIKARVPDAIRFLRHEPLRLHPSPVMEASNGAAAPGEDVAFSRACEEVGQTALAADGPFIPSDPPAHPEPPTRFLPDDQLPSDDESEDAHA